MKWACIRGSNRRSRHPNSGPVQGMREQEHDYIERAELKLKLTAAIEHDRHTAGSEDRWLCWTGTPPRPAAGASGKRPACPGATTVPRRPPGARPGPAAAANHLCGAARRVTSFYILACVGPTKLLLKDAITTASSCRAKTSQTPYSLPCDERLQTCQTGAQTNFLLDSAAHASF